MLTGMNIPSFRETRAHEGLLVPMKASRTAASITWRGHFQVHQFTCNADWEPFTELTHISGYFWHPVCVSWVFESRPHSEMRTSSNRTKGGIWLSFQITGLKMWETVSAALRLT